MQSDICTRLRVLRAERNLTQQRVAYETDMAQPSYSAIENGRSNPSMQTLIVLADYFNVSIDYLVGRSEKRSNL